MVRKRRFHPRQPGGNSNNGKNDTNGKNDKNGTGGRNGTNENRFPEPPMSLCKFLCQSVDCFFFELISYRRWRVSCTGRGVKTEHLTVRTTVHHRRIFSRARNIDQ